MGGQKCTNTNTDAYKQKHIRTYIHKDIERHRHRHKHRYTPTYTQIDTLT